MYKLHLESGPSIPALTTQPQSLQVSETEICDTFIPEILCALLMNRVICFVLRIAHNQADDCMNSWCYGLSWSIIGAQGMPGASRMVHSSCFSNHPPNQISITKTPPPPLHMKLLLYGKVSFTLGDNMTSDIFRSVTYFSIPSAIKCTFIIHFDVCLGPNAVRVWSCVWPRIRVTLHIPHGFRMTFQQINGHEAVFPEAVTIFDHNFKIDAISYWVLSLRVASIPSATLCGFLSEYWSKIK